MSVLTMNFAPGSVALVTGASRGIGRACAVHLAHAGCDVVVHYNSRLEAAEETAESVRALGRQALVVQADVAKEADVRTLFGRVRSEWGRLDTAVVNSGITADGYLGAMSMDKWASVIDTNLTGTFLTCRHAVRMMHRSGGSLVLISSTSGVMGQPGQTNYSASKGGIIAFGKALAREAADKDIRVNTVAPGFTETDMLRLMNPKARESYLELVPMGRAGAPAEVASAVTFLASPAAGYVTGKVLTVDGGLTS